MSGNDPEPSRIAELLRHVNAANAELLLADQGRLRERARQIEQRLRQKLLVDRGVRSLEQDFQRARQRFQRRQAWQPKIHFPGELPISAKRDEIIAMLERHQVVIVCGDTGSGKTTQLPKLALQAGRGRRGRIGCTQPRRLAAVSMARRVAEELRTECGRQVGYQVRFENRTGDDTAIKFMTDGILLAETGQDRLLWQYDTLIIDEAHERSLNIDFILGYLKNLLPQRPDLKLIVSSATLDPESFAKFFGNATVITVEGRTYPIEDIFFPPVVEEEDTIRHVGRAVRWVDELDAAGDVLIFLPGEREIRDAAELLRGKKYPNTEILPLFARLSLADQQRVFTPGGRRRIVLATNVAETSLTIPGIRYVIDSGLVRIGRYRPRRQIQSLQIEQVSQASARQRRGRCGRVADGVCVHLYSEEVLQQSPAFTDPEIRRSSLAEVILQMEVLGLPTIDQFPFMDPPSGSAIDQGYQTLFEIGALDEKRKLTPLGRELTEFPLDPQIARMIVRGRDEYVVSEMLVLAAALSIQDPRERPMEKPKEADAAHEQWRDGSSDFFTYLRLWNAWQDARKKLQTNNRLQRWCRTNFLSFRRMQEWQNLFRELADIVHELRWDRRVDETVHDDCFSDRIHRSILAGVPLHIGVRGEGMEYQGTGGRAFFLFPGSGLFKSAPRWVVAFPLVETGKLYARTVGAIQPQWVEQAAPHLCRASHHDVQWDAEQGFVYAREAMSCGGLTLFDDRQVHYGRIDPAKAREIFIRDGLTTGKLRSRSPWLKEHRALLEEIARREQKLRRPHGLLDEHAIQQHFEQMVPRDVCSTKSFDQWIQREHPSIALALEDATAEFGEPYRAEDFPDELTVHGYRFALQYRCLPGTPGDGIVLSCPQPLVRSLPPWVPDWVVPGWLSEKVRLLIRSLPKNLSAAFHPIQTTASQFVEDVRSGKISAEQPLAVALAGALSQRLGKSISPEQFDLSRLPEHLIMKVAVVDATGKIIHEERGRPTDELYSSQLQPTSAWFPREWNRSGMRDWDVPALPDSIILASVPREVRGYPALFDDGETTGVGIFLDPTEAAQRHAAGVMRLCRLKLAGDITTLQKKLPLPAATRLTLLALTSNERSGLDDFIDMIVEEALRNGRSEFPRDPEAFRQRLESARTSLFRLAEQRGRELTAILEQRDAFLTTLNTTRRSGVACGIADVEQQLAFLFRPGFLRAGNTWTQYPRYLRALCVRLERMTFDPAKDLSKWETIRPFQELLDGKLALLDGRGMSPELARFAQLLQEFRVARFAPEIGAVEKVSPQRLDEAWSAALKE